MLARKPTSYSENWYYLVGFALALMLTILAFGLVALKTGEAQSSIGFLMEYFPWAMEIFKSRSNAFFLAGIFILAMLQVLIHLRYFLHLSFDPANNSKMVIMTFTMLIILLLVGGSIWIMADLDRLMLPPHPN